MSTESIPYEQAVFGSFAFWDQGYAILAKSPGCRPEWISDFRAVCGRHGERPAGAVEADSLFCLKLPSGPWIVVGVFPQGRDDVGRPGALAFHALFLKGADYRRAGASPFPFRPLLKGRWSAADRTLNAGIFVPPPPGEEPVAVDPAADRIARAIERGRRVLVESPEPIEELARNVWATMNARTRAKAGLSTWAFAVTNSFHLIGMPRVPMSIERPFVRSETLTVEEEAALSASATRPSQGLLVRVLGPLRSLGRRGGKS